MKNAKTSKLTSELKYFSQALLIPLYALSHLAGRDKNLWVFGSTFGSRFADNPRYFFYYLSQLNDEEKKRAGLKHREKIRPVWITKNPSIAGQLKKMGYEAYLDCSKEGIKCCLKAGVYVFDNYSKDISFWLSGGAKKINLWHGTPLKKIQMDNQFDKVRHPENLKKWLYWRLRRMSDEKPRHYVLTTSEFFRPIFASAFATKNVLVCGYPRNDCLLNGIRNDLLPGEKKKLNWLLKRLKKNPSCKVISYMPTFRDSETKFFETVNIRELSEYLKENNYYLIIKLHPKSKLQLQFDKELQLQFDKELQLQFDKELQLQFDKELQLQSQRILLLSNQDDPYEFLKYTHALITDYSSVYFDYLVLDRPVIFFDYDRREYLSKSRELYFDYDGFTPGRKAANWQELKKALESINWNKDSSTDGFEQKRHEIRELSIDVVDSNASRRLLAEIRNILRRTKTYERSRLYHCSGRRKRETHAVPYCQQAKVTGSGE